MVAAPNRLDPFNLVVTGEAEAWQPALEKIVGPRYLRICLAKSRQDLLELAASGQAHAAVLDDEMDWDLGVLNLLRLVRRVNELLPVVVISSRRDRRWLEDAMRLAVFSVVVRPLALEELLRQIQRMMLRMDELLRADPGQP